MNTKINLTYKGESKTIYEWSLETGISSSTISARIKKYHWTTERALTEQPFIGKNQSFHLNYLSYPQNLKFYVL